MKLYNHIIYLINELQNVITLSFQEQISVLDDNLKMVLEIITSKQRKKNKLKELKLYDNESISLLFNEIKEQIVEELEILPKNIIENTLITDNFSIAGLFSSEHYIRKQKIPAQHIVEAIITNDLIAEIYRLFDLLENKAVEFNNKIQNYNRLLQYSINKEDINLLSPEITNLDDFLKSKQQNINLLK